MRGIRQVFAAIVAASICAACGDRQSSADSPSAATAAGDSPASMASVTGTISYRERIALTNAAEAVVALEDASRQDIPAIRLAQQTISDPGQVPIRFTLDVPRTAIDPRGSYALRAQISDRGRLLFTTDTHTPALTRGASDEVHLLLVPVADSGGGPRATEGAFIEKKHVY